MLNLIRIAAVTGRVDPGSPAGCRKYLTEEIKKAGAHSPDVILLPSDILLPPSAQSLRRQGFMLDLCRQELSRLAEDLRELPSLLFVGLPVSLHGVTVSAMAALRQGELLGFVLPPFVPEGPLPEGFLPASAVFEAGGAGCGCSPAVMPARRFSTAPLPGTATVCCCPAMSLPEWAAPTGQNRPSAS